MIVVISSERFIIDRMSDYKPRDVYEICEEILKLVPDTETELLYDLMAFRDTLWNKAPEIRKGPDLWRHFGYIMNQHIRSTDETWQKNLIRIFNNQ